MAADATDIPEKRDGAGAGARIDALIAAAVAAGLIVIVLLYIALFTWSARIDAISANREVQLVQNGVASQIREVQDSITSVTQWDDAVARTNPPINREWVHVNIGVFLAQSIEIETAAVVGAAGEALYAMKAGQEVDPAALSELMTAAAPLIAEVRRKEAERGVLAAGDGATVVSTPIRSSAGALLDDTPFIVTATLVQPDFGRALPDGPQGAIVITAARFDAPFERLTTHYLLEEASLHGGTAPAQTGRARAFLWTPDGSPAATVFWAPQTPGRQLLSAALPVLGIATLVLVAGGIAALAALRVNLRSLRRTMRDLVEARDAAQVADRAKSQFLAFMSHEIRTPLNGVLGMAQILLMKEKDPARREQLQIIKGSGESLLAILNDILDLSRIEAQKMKLELAPFDLSAMVTQACAPFRNIAESKGLSFTVDIAESAQGEWMGDAVRLRQILTNLIANAVKFTERGRISVSVAVSGQPDAPRLEMRVEDSGVGIPTAALPQLFQRFVQADSSHSRRFGGAGLGLAISQDLARLMGGKIHVQSVEGQGATFRFEAPLRRPASDGALAA